MAETNLRGGQQLSRDDFTGFLTNPILGTFLALAALSILWRIWAGLRPQKAPKLLGKDTPIPKDPS